MRFNVLQRGLWNQLVIGSDQKVGAACIDPYAVLTPQNPAMRTKSDAGWGVYSAKSLCEGDPEDNAS